MMQDKNSIYQKQGFGGRSGFGHLSALILVDFVNGFVDPELLGSLSIAKAAEETVELLRFCRERQLPVAHTRVVFDEHGANHNVFTLRVPALKKLTETAFESQIVEVLKPLPNELVIKKQSASAFFSTGLSDWLTYHRVDTTLIVGCTTSGCVRASVVDSMQHNYKTVVVSDCVADRAQDPHDANLFDMQQKYADVMSKQHVIEHLETLGVNRP
jgi:maleamate amidohydrolase